MRTRTFGATALIISLFASTCLSAQTGAPAKPDVNFITQTISKVTLPAGGSEEEMMAMWQEYFDKVISKSTLVKHFTLYRHAWGSLGASVVITFEFATWADIEKWNEVELDALAAAAWPDEAARGAFFDKFDSYLDRHHRDEIYVVRNSMRR